MPIHRCMFLLPLGLSQPRIGGAARSVEAVSTVSVVDRQRQCSEGRVGVGPSFEPPHFLDIVHHQIHGLLQRGIGDLHVVFAPVSARPTNHLDPEEARVVGKSGLLQRPMNHEKMFQLLPYRGVLWRPKLEPDKGPTVLMKDGNIRCGVDVNTVNIGGCTTVKIRPAVRPADKKWSQRYGVLQRLELLQTAVYTLQLMEFQHLQLRIFQRTVHLLLNRATGVGVGPNLSEVLVVHPLQPCLTHCSHENFVVGPWGMVGPRGPRRSVGGPPCVGKRPRPRAGVHQSGTRLAPMRRWDFHAGDRFGQPT